MCGIVGEVDDMETQPSQHYDVQNDIGEEPKKPVPISGNPQRGASDDVFIVVSSPAGFRKCCDDRLG